MPFHLAPFTRRQFISRTVGGGIAILTSPALFGAESPGGTERWALFSDTHISADPQAISRNVNMADHLRAAVKEVGALSPAPLNVLINGDCALDHGLPEDYTTWLDLLQPLRTSGLPVHCTLGNHDARDVFWNAVKDAAAQPRPVGGKFVSVLESGAANWFLLDSLDVTKQTPGRVGEAQLHWLASALDERSQKPALVMVHHNPDFRVEGKKSGLLDTHELLEVLLSRKQVKALFYGHSHTWRLAQQDGLHLINLPAVAYPFDPSEVTGWVDCHLQQYGMTLEVRAYDPQHPVHGQTKRLAWRA